MWFKRWCKQFLSISVLFALFPITTSAIEWHRVGYESVRTSTEAAALVDRVLRSLHLHTPPGVEPVVLLIKPENGVWTRLHQEIVSSLSRYGVKVEGMELNLETLSGNERLTLQELSQSSMGHTVLTVEDRGSFTERILSRAAGMLGLQQVREHFRRLREFRREQREIRRIHRSTYPEEPTEETLKAYDKALQQALKLAPHYYRFRWVNSLPKGFGGSPLAQLLYMTTASINTFSFSLLNSEHRGLPEVFLWSFTYLYQTGQDYINYLRKAGRVPRWYDDPQTGERCLTTDIQKTYGRLFFFATTWTIVAGCNLLVVSPIMIAQGAESAFPWLGQVVSNATFGVFSFAFIDAFFSRLRQKELSLRSEAKRIEERLQQGGDKAVATKMGAINARYAKVRPHFVSVLTK